MSKTNLVVKLGQLIQLPMIRNGVIQETGLVVELVCGKELRDWEVFLFQPQLVFFCAIKKYVLAHSFLVSCRHWSAHRLVAGQQYGDRKQVSRNNLNIYSRQNSSGDTTVQYIL